MLVFLFTDIEGSTRLWEQHTAAMRDVITRHDAILQAQIEACGGKITKHTGDGVTAVFDGGEPVCCALETQLQFAREAWPAVGEVRIRVAIHAGEAQLLAGDYFGPAVNCTARILAASWGGQILLTPEVDRTCSRPANASLLDLGLHLLKDVSAPQQIYQLVHPALPWQEFPPLRTLSSTAISRTIDQQGQRLATLSAPAIGAGLVSAALLPVVRGDLAPSSPALVGNLGLLADLGAHALREWMEGFVERLRAAQRAGAAMTEMQVRKQLETELLELWEAGEAGSVLRSDASRLLHAVQGVEAVEGASVDVRRALAIGLADLGRRFGEFRWMLDGLGQALADIQATGQDTRYLATQILERLQEVEILDLTRLTGTPEEKVQALERALDQRPGLDDRLQIVDGLASLEVRAATDALLQVALTDDAPEVRAKAAVAAARRGHATEIVAGLMEGMAGPNQAAALATFAEVADAVGIPEDLGPYPRTQVLLALAWKRWQAHREAILRQTIRAGFGGVSMALFGCLVPLFVYLARPEVYYDWTENTMPLSAWVFSSAIMFLLIGGVQGAASGFVLAVTDALSHNIAHRALRLILGTGSGLALSTLLILVSLWQVAGPDVGPAVFIPVYVVYGLAFGAACTAVIPRLGARRSLGQQLRRAALAVPVTAVTTVPYVFLVYPTMVAETLPYRLCFAVVFPATMALAFVGRANEASRRRSPRAERRGI